MENYEKKYKELEGKIKKAYLYAQTDSTKAVLEDILPELAESEDEKIRKMIINTLNRDKILTEDEAYDCVVWLEKQKSVEEIVARCKKSWYNEGKIAGMAEGLTDDEKYQQGWHDALEKQGKKEIICDKCKKEHPSHFCQDITALGRCALEHNTANNVEPKFHKGEWIISNDKKSTYQVIEVKRGIYVIRDNADNHEYHIGIEECEKSGRIWGVSDAKDGDVLSSNVLLSKYNKPFIYNGNHNSTHVGAYCGISTENRFNVATEKCRWTANVNIRPATKEQRDTLFAKMKEAGYEWNAEKKELKLLITNGGDFFESKNWEQNSAWSNGYSNGYIQAVEKAVEWLENHNDYIDVKDGNVTYFDMEKCVEDFRKAMKGGEE